MIHFTNQTPPQYVACFQTRTTETWKQKISKKRVPAPLQALGFTLNDIHQARLAPVVDFKGRKPKTAPPADKQAEN